MYTAHVHFFTNLDIFCIDNARVIYRKIRYLKNFHGIEDFYLCIPQFCPGPCLENSAVEGLFFFWGGRTC